jgi:hypothetical protein
LTINQWNEDGESGNGDENSDSIVASNLVRFRLCPSSSCQDKTSTGCSSKYGDYLVDVNSFVYSYLSAQDSSDDDSFNAINYAQCAAYNDYYLGPSCSSDGKSILLAAFDNDQCTELSSCDSSCLSSKYGTTIPFSDSSMISKSCVSCSYDYEAQQADSYNNYGASDACKNLYSNAGKCETKMNIDYPNESACTYIQGIKYLQKDGTISSSSTRRSKGASLVIGFLSFGSFLLAFYVHYLSTSKLVAFLLFH